MRFSSSLSPPSSSSSLSCCCLCSKLPCSEIFLEAQLPNYGAISGTMFEASGASSPVSCTTSCRYQPFASRRTPPSAVLNSFIYASPSVHERLAYGILVLEAERAVEMAGLMTELERVIEGQK